MRIGLSTSVIGRGQTGISRYVCSLTKAFLHWHPQHQFVLFVLEEDLALFSFAADSLILVPVSERFREPLRNICWHQLVLPRLARQHRLDVLHVPSYRRMLWPKPAALVATIHDLAPFHVTGKYDWKRMLYGQYGARILARRQDEILTISQSTARDIVRFFGVSPERVTVTYCGLDHDHFSPGSPAQAQADVSARFGLDRPFFLYVARLEHPGKNHVNLITAFNEFKAQTSRPELLVLAGKDWTGAEAIRKAAHASKFAADIRFLGFVAEADLPALYRVAQALVCPSLFEGFGLPLAEAMACGCPVLCSRSGALLEVVGNAALTVDAQDISALTDNLVRLAGDESLRQRLREAGLARAKQFDWHKAAAATLAVYARAITRTGNFSHPSARQVVPLSPVESPPQVAAED